MKKARSLILVLLLIFTLSACTRRNPNILSYMESHHESVTAHICEVFLCYPNWTYESTWDVKADSILLTMRIYTLNDLNDITKQQILNTYRDRAPEMVTRMTELQKDMPELYECLVYVCEENGKPITTIKMQ